MFTKIKMVRKKYITPFFKKIFCPSYGITLSYLLFLSLFIKMYLLYFLDSSRYETYSFFVIIADLSSYFFSDLLVWIISLFFVILAMVARRTWIRRCYVFIVFAFLFLFAVDLVTLYFAGFRLSILDLLAMSKGASSWIVNVFNPICCILLIYLFFWFFLHPHHQHFQQRLNFWGFFSVAYTSGSQPRDQCNYGNHNPWVENRNVYSETAEIEQFNGVKTL